jgi:hypothetical protein
VIQIIVYRSQVKKPVTQRLFYWLRYEITTLVSIGCLYRNIFGCTSRRVYFFNYFKLKLQRDVVPSVATKCEFQSCSG